MKRAIGGTGMDIKVICDSCKLELWYDQWLWKDCDISGHDEGCFMLVCPGCGDKDRDCEDQ